MATSPPSLSPVGTAPAVTGRGPDDVLIEFLQVSTDDLDGPGSSSPLPTVRTHVARRLSSLSANGGGTLFDDLHAIIPSVSSPSFAFSRSRGEALCTSIWWSVPPALAARSLSFANRVTESLFAHGEHVRVTLVEGSSETLSVIELVPYVRSRQPVAVTPPVVISASTSRNLVRSLDGLSLQAPASGEPHEAGLRMLGTLPPYGPLAGS